MCNCGETVSICAFSFFPVCVCCQNFSVSWSVYQRSQWIRCSRRRMDACTHRTRVSSNNCLHNWGNIIQVCVDWYDCILPKQLHIALSLILQVSEMRLEGSTPFAQRYSFTWCFDDCSHKTWCSIVLKSADVEGHFTWFYIIFIFIKPFGDHCYPFDGRWSHPGREHSHQDTNIPF